MCAQSPPGATRGPKATTGPPPPANPPTPPEGATPPTHPPPGGGPRAGPSTATSAQYASHTSPRIGRMPPRSRSAASAHAAQSGYARKRRRAISPRTSAARSVSGTSTTTAKASRSGAAATRSCHHDPAEMQAALAQVDCHALALREALEHALKRVLAAETALLESPIGLSHDLADALIDLTPTRIDRVRGAKRLADVPGPDVRGEPVVRLVGHAHRVGLVAPRDCDEHRTENLLACDPPLVPHVREDSRLDVVPGGERSLGGRPAADHSPRARLVKAFVNVSPNLFKLLAADDRTHVVAFVERIADLEFRELRGEPVEERVEDARVDEETRAGGAGLALPGEAHRRHYAGRGALLVGVGVQDLRALAAELERDRDDAISSETEDRLPGLGVPGEGDLADQRMRRERRADLFARAGDDVQHALREMGRADAG